MKPFLFRHRSIDATPEGGYDTVVAAATVVEGDIEFSGTLQVEGEVRGHIMADDDASRLMVSKEGRVEGGVDVAHVVVAGTISGNVISRGSVELRAGASVAGDVHYKTLTMDVGATVNGNLICEAEGSRSTWRKPPA